MNNFNVFSRLFQSTYNNSRNDFGDRKVSRYRYSPNTIIDSSNVFQSNGYWIKIKYVEVCG